MKSVRKHFAGATYLDLSPFCTSINDLSLKEELKETKKGNGNGTLTQTHAPFLLLPDQQQPGAKTFTWGAREATVSRRVQKWQ